LAFVALVILFLIIITIFSFSEQSMGVFQWWLIYFLVGFFTLLVLTMVIPVVGRVFNWITSHVGRYIGFESEPQKQNVNIRRDYFMSVVPLFFIISGYLMKSAINNGKQDIFNMSLSIVMLLFALYLVFAAFYRKLPETVSHITYQAASQLSTIGSLVFTIDVLSMTAELIKLGVSPLFVYAFFMGGMLTVLCIMFFSVISLVISNSTNNEEKASGHS